jgi:hypothetical protein
LTPSNCNSWNQAGRNLEDPAKPRQTNQRLLPKAVIPIFDASQSPMNAFPHSANAPTNATQAKDRLYSQLASSLTRMSRAIGQTADLCEQLQVDLYAMRTFAGLDAAKWVYFLG